MKRIDEYGNTLFSDFYKKEFIEEFTKHGSVIIENVLSPEFIKKTIKELEFALEKEIEFQGTKDYSYYGYVLSNAIYGGSFLDLFDNEKVVQPINSIMGEGSIAYSYTSSSMPPFKGNDSSHIHVDCPIFLSEYLLRMGVLIPLVDLTFDNGATYYLHGSHNTEETPCEQEFLKKSKRLVVKAGTAWFFNTRLWHMGGKNNTKNWRHALTINICRPWMKQRIDIPALMKNMDLSKVSDQAKQKLGFYSQVPRSYEEYFNPSDTPRIFI